MSTRENPIEDKVILKALKGLKRGLDRQGIADKLGVSRHRLIRRMNTMADAGLVREVQPGTFVAA